MCGIAGYIGKEIISDGNIRETLTLMLQRGPDFQSSVVIDEQRTKINLLHTRLSILDIEARSNQPFTKQHCTVVFNGEIYNYKELRKELEKLGHIFSTQSDTEVLLSAYIEYGEKCVDYFEGMWSFALYDSKRKKLLLSRDRFAEKPLYIHRTGDGVYFASETKFMKSLTGKTFEKNYNQIKRYLVNGHKSLYKHGDTFYKEIDELDYASNAVIDLNLNFNQYKYWQPEFEPNNNLTESEAIEGIKEKLINSVKLRLRSDVPIAFCLSGGVDSASLVSIASKVLNANVNTFSIIDGDERYDEEDNIDATISDTGCKSHKIKLSPLADNIGRLTDLVKYHDAPVATISYFVHSMLSEAISKNGFKISISGTAADEFFTGYYDHFTLHFYELRNAPEFAQLKADWEKHVQHFVRHPAFQQYDFYFDKPSAREHIYLNNKEFASYLKHDFSEAFQEINYTPSLLRNRMLNELFHEVVRVILHEDDLNSMRYSVENRSPFLDTSLFNFANSIPSKHLIKNGYAKYLLREAMKGILNDEVRLAREKKGFNASISSIIDFDNKEHIDFILADNPIFDLVDKTKIENIIRKKEYTNSYKKFLFNFINLKIFLDN